MVSSKRSAANVAELIAMFKGDLAAVSARRTSKRNAQLMRDLGRRIAELETELAAAQAAETEAA